MACLLKCPVGEAKGFITFTTQERDFQIKKDPSLRRKILSMKDRWYFGLHHNWHDFNFVYDELFDFSMAGDGDLIEVSNKKFSRISIDACNFVPPIFFKEGQEKFWDILYVARAVNFKRIPEFFKIIKNLYSSEILLRVLFICPIPPYNPKDKKSTFYDIRKEYDRIFTEDEKNSFTLLTMDYRYPFPFDLDSLSFFYRSSKIFVHTADDERRCRVAAYAWSSGLPVVGMDCVGSLLPEKLRRPPYFYEAKSHADFESNIIKALDNLNSLAWIDAEIKREFLESDSCARLIKELDKFVSERREPFCDEGLFEKNLSIRLGRHHNGIAGPNSIAIKLDKFLDRVDSPNFSAQNDNEREQIEEGLETERIDGGGIIKRIFKLRNQNA